MFRAEVVKARADGDDDPLMSCQIADCVVYGGHDARRQPHDDRFANRGFPTRVTVNRRRRTVDRRGEFVDGEIIEASASDQNRGRVENPFACCGRSGLFEQPVVACHLEDLPMLELWSAWHEILYLKIFAVSREEILALHSLIVRISAGQRQTISSQLLPHH